MTGSGAVSGSAREAVLGRIRDAHRLAPPPDLAYEAIARDYRRERPGTTEELVELLVRGALAGGLGQLAGPPRLGQRHRQRLQRQPRAAGDRVGDDGAPGPAGAYGDEPLAPLIEY